MRGDTLITTIGLLGLLACAEREAEVPSMVGEFASERRGLSIELKADGTFEAGLARWTSPMGCMLLIQGQATGGWSVDADEVQFFDVQATGELGDTFYRARIDEGGSAIVLPSRLGLGGERLERGGRYHYLFPDE